MGKFKFENIEITTPDIWSDVSAWFKAGEDEPARKPFVLAPNEEYYMEFIKLSDLKDKNISSDYLYELAIKEKRKLGYKEKAFDICKRDGGKTIAAASVNDGENFHRLWCLSDKNDVLMVLFHAEIKCYEYYFKICEEIIENIEFLND